MDNPKITIQPEGPQTESSIPVKKRPTSVTLLALIVLIITIVNIIRFILSIRYWSFLFSRSAISPFYLALTGLVWSVVGAILIWGLWKAKTWGPMLMQAVGLTYALYYWLDQIFLKDHPVSGTSGTIRVLLPTNWQFAAFVTAFCLVFMVWVLGRKKVKKYFGIESSTDSKENTNNSQ
jgi:hypothetical protein